MSTDKPTPFFDYLGQFEEGRALLDGYYKSHGQPVFDVKSAAETIKAIRLQLDALNQELEAGSTLNTNYIEASIRSSFAGLSIDMEAYREYLDLLYKAEHYIAKALLNGNPTDLKEITKKMDKKQKTVFDGSKSNIRYALKDRNEDPIVRLALTLWSAERLRSITQHLYR